MKFNIGDKVTFKRLRWDERCVPDYDTNGPNVKHGQTVLLDPSQRNGHIVRGSYIRNNIEYVEVEYIDGRNNPVCLGFKEENLIPMKITNWKKRILGEDNQSNTRLND